MAPRKPAKPAAPSKEVEVPANLKVPKVASDKDREPTARLGGGQDSKRGSPPAKAGAKAGAKAAPAKAVKLAPVAEAEKQPTPAPTGAKPNNSSPAPRRDSVAPGMPGTTPTPAVKTITTATGAQKKIEYLSEDLMCVSRAVEGVHTVADVLATLLLTALSRHVLVDSLVSSSAQDT